MSSEVRNYLVLSYENHLLRCPIVAILDDDGDIKTTEAFRTREIQRMLHGKSRPMRNTGIIPLSVGYDGKFIRTDEKLLAQYEADYGPRKNWEYVMTAADLFNAIDFDPTRSRYSPVMALTKERRG